MKNTVPLTVGVVIGIAAVASAVGLDLIVPGLHRWFQNHSMTTSAIASLTVVFFAVLVIEQLQRSREQARRASRRRDQETSWLPLQRALLARLFDTMRTLLRSRTIESLREDESRWAEPMNPRDEEAEAEMLDQIESWVQRGKGLPSYLRHVRGRPGELRSEADLANEQLVAVGELAARWMPALELLPTLREAVIAVLRALESEVTAFSSVQDGDAHDLEMLYERRMETSRAAIDCARVAAIRAGLDPDGLLPDLVVGRSQTVRASTEDSDGLPF